MPATSSSSIRFNQAHVWPTVLQSSEEWQKCLASILKEKYGGASKEIIYDKFLLRPATCRETDGNIRVAWLCDKHYNGWHTCIPARLKSVVLLTEIWEKKGSKYLTGLKMCLLVFGQMFLFLIDMYFLTKHRCMLMYLNPNFLLGYNKSLSLFVLWMGVGFCSPLVMFSLITTW